jgi:hypothetical protein
MDLENDFQSAWFVSQRAKQRQKFVGPDLEAVGIGEHVSPSAAIRKLKTSAAVNRFRVFRIYAGMPPSRHSRCYRWPRFLQFFTLLR